MAEPIVKNIGENNRKAHTEIDNVLEELDPTRLEMVVLVLPNNFKNIYKRIKYKLLCEKKILSQVVLHGTLERKGFPTICS